MNTPHTSGLRFVNLVCVLAITAGSIPFANAQPATAPAQPATPAATTQAPAAAPATGAVAPGGPGGAAPAGRGFGGGGFGGGAQPLVLRGRGRGPAASPVPPEVAYPRPTPAEIAQINAELTKVIAADTSETKPLLDKYATFIMVQPARANTATIATTMSPRFGARHDGFVEIAKKGDIDLLLEGDSITDWWISQNGTPTAAYTKYFGNIKTADFAVAGDTTQGVLWGLQNGEGVGFQPKAIMLMIGTNNTGTNTAQEIAEGVGADVYELRKDFPNAKILLLAIFPRADPGAPVRDKIADINKIISKLADNKNVFYMDIGSKFLDDKGVFLPDAFRADKLHPLEKGYDIWGAAVKDQLDSMLK